MKEFLSRAGVAFVERNVEEDPSAYDELVHLGWRTVPLTLINGMPIKGYDVAALEDALRAASGSSRDR